MMNLFEALNVTDAQKAQILSDPHVQMGFEVEFVYVSPESKTPQAAFKLAQQQLKQLGLKFGSTGYHLVPDASIDTNKRAHHFGIELVSAPMPLAQGMQELSQVFAWMRENQHETNHSTGLHINISVTGLQPAKLNKLKLLLLLDEHRVQQQFDRVLNDYTQSHVRILKQAIAQAVRQHEPWTQIREVNRLQQVLNASIDLEKYRTINFSKLEKGYLEFRIMGNQDYHKREALVMNTIITYAFALLAALDPGAFQAEYTQALGRMFSAGLNQAQPMWPDLSHKYASVGAAPHTEGQLKVLDLITRAKKAMQDNNPRAAVRLITMAIQKADAHSYTDVKPDLINAAALSYRILIKKLLGFDVKQFTQAQKEAGVLPPVIQQTKTYLTQF